MQKYKNAKMQTLKKQKMGNVFAENFKMLI